MKVLSLFLLILSMAILNACGEAPVAEEPDNTNTTTEVETAPAEPVEEEYVFPDNPPLDCPTNIISSDVTVRTTEELAELEGVTHIQGKLDMNDSTFSDLTPLECLRQINGALMLDGNDRITTLEPLRSLRRIGSYISIWGSDNISNLDGFRNLEEIGGQVSLSSVDRLTNLEGLHQIKKLPWGLHIHACRQLESLKGLKSLEEVNDTYSITYNDSLPDCEVHEFYYGLLTRPHPTQDVVYIGHNDMEATCE